MPTNLGIDDALLAKAQKLGKHRTKKETVNTALAAYIKHLEQLKVTDYFGKVIYEPKYDYKAERKRS